MDIGDVITQILPKDILPQIITYGLLYFILIFYGSDKWKTFSDFEKIVFSVLSGGIVWYFLVAPISFFLTMLKIFQNELPEIKYYDLYPQGIYLLYLIFIYLLVWRLIFNNKPLRDDKSFFQSTKYLIIAVVIFLLLVDYTLLAAFLFSEYQEYLNYIATSISFSIAILILFYPIFLALYGEKITPPLIDEFFANLKLKENSLRNILSRNKTTIKWSLLIIFIIIFIVVAPFTGIYLLKTTTQLVDEKPDRFIIDSMFITRAYRNISGDFFVWQNYSIKFGIIPWAKFKPNISLKNRFDEPANSYSFRGDYILINNSGFNTTNVILYGKKEINNLPKFYLYTFEISDLNDTIQKWDIKFNNSYPYDIEINEVIIDPARELRFINYHPGNLSLGDIINEEQRIIIRHVWIAPDPNKIYSNRSITLFFEKKIQ